MNSIKSQIDYARTQPWFTTWINALYTCNSDSNGGDIIDLLLWANTSEGHAFWRDIHHAGFDQVLHSEVHLADLQPYLPDYPEIFL